MGTLIGDIQYWHFECTTAVELDVDAGGERNCAYGYLSVLCSLLPRPASGSMLHDYGFSTMAA